MLTLLQFIFSVCFSFEFGIDQLQFKSEQLTNKNIAVLAHAASVDKKGNHLIDLLYPKYKLKKIFSPEHGLRSGQDDYVGDGIDSKTGLPVISLYKQNSRAPRVEDLKDIDLVVLDLQDVGVRYYTYFSTVAEFIKVAATLKIPVLLLDRPNPIGGVVEGAKLQADLKGHFISYHDIPTRHGMTLGELTLLFNEEEKVEADIEVVKVLGWSRGNLIHSFDRAWVPSSPALTSLEQVMLYAQLGSLESLKLAVGRGVDNSSAFKVLAAPFISRDDAKNLALNLNSLKLKNITFYPYCYLVDRAIFLGENVCGVKLETTPGFEINASDEMTYKMAKILYHSFPENIVFNNFAHRYFGNFEWIDAIKANIPWSKFKHRLKTDKEAFELRKAPFLL